MVLGLIDFLLGGKKKTQPPKNKQTGASYDNAQSSNVQQNQVENNQNENVNNTNNQGNATTIPQGNLNFQDSNSQNSNQPQNNSSVNNNQNSGTKKSLSEVLNKIRSELKETNDNIVNLNTEIKDLQGTVSSMEHRVSDLETKTTTSDEQLKDINNNMSKFLSLYELVNNQYNPFIDQDASPEPKKIVLNNDGTNQDEQNNQESENESIQKLDISNYTNSSQNRSSKDDLKHSLLELDTLNIEEAASDAVPLTSLKTNTNSLVIILSWLEYLVKRIGVEESKNILRYYTETLKWITPEVFFELDKFLKGMDDIDTEKKSKSLNVKDHIVSLYFISKLNEKNLDEKLTKAVLQIINNE